jgi:hypothetical protein
LAIRVYVIIEQHLMRGREIGPVASRQVALYRGRLGPPREREFDVSFPVHVNASSRVLNAAAGYKVVLVAIRNNGDKAEPHPILRLLEEHRPTLTTSAPLKFSTASLAIAAFWKSWERI